jgi:hypothetical protein
MIPEDKHKAEEPREDWEMGKPPETEHGHEPVAFLDGHAWRLENK